MTHDGHPWSLGTGRPQVGHVVWSVRAAIAVPYARSRPRVNYQPRRSRQRYKSIKSIRTLTTLGPLFAHRCRGSLGLYGGSAPVATQSTWDPSLTTPLFAASYHD